MKLHPIPCQAALCQVLPSWVAAASHTTPLPAVPCRVPFRGSSWCWRHTGAPRSLTLPPLPPASLRWEQRRRLPQRAPPTQRQRSASGSPEVLTCSLCPRNHQQAPCQPASFISGPRRMSAAATCDCLQAAHLDQRQAEARHGMAPPRSAPRSWGQATLWSEQGCRRLQIGSTKPPDQDGNLLRRRTRAATCCTAACAAAALCSAKTGCVLRPGPGMAATAVQSRQAQGTPCPVRW